jgi:predicted AAA+ superfamily ATPase
MKRNVFNLLLSWKNIATRKPMILRGARQVGKSWLAKELGKTFQHFVEINFDKSPEYAEFFKMTKEPGKLVELISNYSGQKIAAGSTLLFLDEIQNCPAAIGSLRYFYEEMPELHVLAAGSLLEFELQKLSIPVGRVQFLHIYPMSFSEFLDAAGREDWHTMLLDNARKPLAIPIHKLLLEYIRTYTIVGGMPEVIAVYLANKNLRECQNVQSDILLTYRQDFHKYAQKKDIKYLQKLLTTIPHQAGRKFIYAAVDQTIKSAVLSEALDLLCLAGVVQKIYHSDANGIPLSAEANFKKFKTSFFDIGLTLNLLNLDFKPMLLNPDISLVNSGALAEQFVAQELIAYANPRQEFQLHYWHREAKSSNAEVDYVIEFHNDIIPIEVKSGPAGTLKSLRMFMESKKSSFGVKISSAPYSATANIHAIPFYGIAAFLSAARAEGLTG